MYDDGADILEKALDKITAQHAQQLRKNIDDLWDEVDENDEAQKVRLAHLLEELREVQEAVAELQDHAADHADRYFLANNC